MSAVEKPLPPSTLDVVFPPNKEYSYFESWQEHPFRYSSEQFELVNAWWLADAALLAYADEGFVRQVIKQTGLEQAGVEVEFLSGASTQSFVAYNANLAIVVFRGTEVRKRERTQGFQNIVDDILADAKCRLVESEQGGQVHRGFKEALEEIWATKDQDFESKGLKACLDRVRRNDGRQRTLWFTGHSLGAALATLAADRYGNVQGLYTFGSPRVGDNSFTADFYVNTYRVVNNNDIVPRLPPAGLYQHVGLVKYIDSTGRLHDNPSIWDRQEDHFRGDFAHLFNRMGHLRSGFGWEIPLDHLTDHAPLYYALHAWNNYVRG